MRKLTVRREEVLDAIRAHIRHIRHTSLPPSRWELARALSLKNASSVDWHLLKLAQKGWIELMPDIQRGIRLLDQDLPVIEPLGEIAAGDPIVAQSRTTERLPAVIADRFRPRPSYFLTVRGDSMNRTGLHDGDLVAIRADAEPYDGKIVVARLDNEVTLKRYRRIDDATVELCPESHNAAHSPLRIDGYVVGATAGTLGSGRNRAAADRAAAMEEKWGVRWRRGAASRTQKDGLDRDCDTRGGAKSELHIDGIAVGALIGQGFNPVEHRKAAP